MCGWKSICFFTYHCPTTNGILFDPPTECTQPELCWQRVFRYFLLLLIAISFAHQFLCDNILETHLFFWKFFFLIFFIFLHKIYMYIFVSLCTLYIRIGIFCGIYIYSLCKRLCTKIYRYYIYLYNN